MKVFIQIFTIYMLSLSLALCGEGGGGIMEIIDILTGQEMLVSEHESNTCNDEPCSPFCICSHCIPILSTPENPFVFAEINIIPPTVEPSFYFFSFASSFHKDIWQPPKLG